MAKNKDRQPPGDYEVGYGKPPKQTQFRSLSDAAHELGFGRKGKKTKTRQINLTRLLSERVAVTHNGGVVRMDPYELSLRAQVKSAVKDRSLPALKEIIRLALEFQLVKPPPMGRQTGNVVQVSKTCPDDIYMIISDPTVSFDVRWEFILQWGLIPVMGGSNE